MTLPSKDTCRACSAKITFGITAKGKRMPLDVDAIIGLELLLESALDGKGGLRGLQVFDDGLRIRQATSEDVTAGRPLYRSHFATCTDPSRFRR